jgi:hypothetical protein
VDLHFLSAGYGILLNKEIYQPLPFAQNDGVLVIQIVILAPLVCKE